MRILNEYPGRHHYWDEFEKTDYFCPECGAKDVWEEAGPGDYYVGADFVCISCGSDWTMQGPGVSKEQNMIGKIEQLKSGVTKAPTTKRGG